MGRSQVIYNRTKGRYKNRGAGGQQQGNNDTSHEKSNYNHTQSHHRGGGRGEPSPGRGRSGRRNNNNYPIQPQPTTTAPKQRRTPKYDESVLLEPPTRIYKTAAVAPDDVMESSTIRGGSMDILSMAAALTTSLKVSQRLYIPPHLAQALAVSSSSLDQPKSPRQQRKHKHHRDNERPSSPISPVQKIKQRQQQKREEEQRRLQEQQRQEDLQKRNSKKDPPGGGSNDDSSVTVQTTTTAKGRKKVPLNDADGASKSIGRSNTHRTAASIDEATSYSVNTRRPIKVRVHADGQVEVRNKTQHFRPADNIRSLDEDEEVDQSSADPSSLLEVSSSTRSGAARRLQHSLLLSSSTSTSQSGDYGGRYDTVDEAVDRLIYDGGGLSQDSSDYEHDRYLVAEEDDVYHVPISFTEGEDSQTTTNTITNHDNSSSNNNNNSESTTMTSNANSMSAVGGNSTRRLVRAAQISEELEEQRDYLPRAPSSAEDETTTSTPPSIDNSKLTSSLSSVPLNANSRIKGTKSAASSSSGAKQVLETESMLDDWLDQAMKTVDDESTTNRSNTMMIRNATNTTGGPGLAIIRDEQDENFHDAVDAMLDEEYYTDGTSTVSSITRSTITQFTTSFDNPITTSNTDRLSRCHTIDSRGILFDDVIGEEDDEDEIEGMTTQESSSYHLHQYPQANSTDEQQQKLLKKKSSKSSKKSKDKKSSGGGEDLDAWLDSVIT